MADIKKKLDTNIDGEFFVDSTCINCDTCRQLAPKSFKDTGEYSSVYAQPKNKDEVRKAIRALLACPTGSIGTVNKNNAKETMEDFPLLLEDNVYYTGFNSPKSYGGNSYFIKHERGNWLIDSPKYLPQLVKKFKDFGGIKYIFLTHSDDVAEASKYAKEFSSIRFIHREELKAQPDAEKVLDGYETIELFSDFLVIPTPGHTKGHCVLLYKNKFLFTGDHMRWSRDYKKLHASKSVCWYSWEEQVKSIERLQAFDFEWVLPGHGQRVKFPRDKMKEAISELINRIKS